jgi:hypothetical protein
MNEKKLLKGPYLTWAKLAFLETFTLLFGLLAFIILRPFIFLLVNNAIISH